MFKYVRVLESMYHRSLPIGYVGSSAHKLCRGFYSNPKLYRKMHLEFENQYAYNIMASKGYVKNLCLPNIDMTLSADTFNNTIQENWCNKSPRELIDIFPILGTYSSKCGLCISNKIFDTYIDNLTDNITHLSDEELEIIFYSLLKWPETASIRTRNYIEVWVALDEECLKRMNKWTYDEMLKFVSLFYMLNVTKASEFCLKALNKLATKAKRLTQSQLVQTMFFTGIMRVSPFDIHCLELQLEDTFTALSIDDLAVIAMGFFKSKTPIRSSDLIVKIIDKVMENSKDIHEVSLAAMLKIIRYSLKLNNNSIIYNMLDTLQYEVPRLSIMCNVQMALVGMPTLTLHKECLKKIAESTIKQMSKTRIKDLERLVLTYGIFNYIPELKENFFDNVIEELRCPDRIPEIEKHGKSFACCVSYLGQLEFYPIDLMSKILSSEFLLHNYGKRNMGYGKEVLTIHNIAKVFCPDADMNRLDDKSSIVLSKKYTDFVPSPTYLKQYNVTERMMLDVFNVLQENRGGEEYVIGDHILTHHQRGDVIMCNDNNGLPVDVRKHFKPDSFGLIRYPPDDNIWIVLVIGGKNSVIYGTDTPTGPYQMKLRELRTLGYHAALVTWWKYNELKTKEEKVCYLNHLINKCINNKIT